MQKGGTTRSNARLAVLIGALLFVVVSGVSLARSQPVASMPVRLSSPPGADLFLRARCLGSPIAAGSTSILRVRETRTTAWGFFLAGSAAGFRPDEAVLIWVFEPSWHAPYCLESGNATTAGLAGGAAAFWYRASIPGRYTLCLVGVGSGRAACGSLELPIASRRYGVI